MELFLLKILRFILLFMGFITSELEIGAVSNQVISRNIKKLHLTIILLYYNVKIQEIVVN